VLRRTSVASVVLALTAAVAGTAAAADIDTVYPSKGDSAVDVSRYGLDLTWKPDAKRLEGIATIRLRGVETGPTFQLDLATSMQVTSVTVAGIAVGFTHDTKDLVVAAPVVAGTTYDVVVTYAGKPRTVAEPTSRGDATGLGWHTTDDGRVWTMQKPYGAYTWYPVNDHPSDKASYTVRLDVPDEWVGVSNGRLDDKTTKDGRTVTKFVGDHPMASYLVTVAIGPYKKYTQDGPHGIPLTYWIPKGKPELLKPLEKTPDALAWLEKKLGPYPFERAGVVVTPGEGSVETQSLTTFGTGNYRYGGADVREQVAHNLAHAWYGDTVTPNDWRDLWMNEGMATYLQAKYAVQQGWETWEFWRREFARNDQYWRDIYGPPGAYHPNEFGQRNVTYGGALIMLRLRGVIGKTAFDATSRSWPQENLDSSRGRARYVEFLEQKTGKTLAPWFQDWLNSETTPAA
jgi:aminopeptidase N